MGYNDERGEWWDHATCARRGYDATWWDVDKKTDDTNVSKNQIKAIALCVECPVRGECIADAIKNGGETTIRGGYLPLEQQELVKTGVANSRILKLIDHATKRYEDPNVVVDATCFALGIGREHE